MPDRRWPRSHAHLKSIRMCCIAGERNSAMVRRMRFRGSGSDGGRRRRSRSWSVRSGNRRWRSIFEGVLAAHRATADAASTDWKAATYQFIEDQAKKGTAMTVVRMCELGHVSRAAFYRVDPQTDRRQFDMDLRDAIQRIALQVPAYGRPRITAEL